MSVRIDLTPVNGRLLHPQARVQAPFKGSRRTTGRSSDVVEEAGPGGHLTAQEIWVRARALQPRIGFRHGAPRG